jgi:hypothetical protein
VRESRLLGSVRAKAEWLSYSTTTTWSSEIIVLGAVVKLGGARRFMGRDLLCVFERSAVLEIGSDASST